MAATIQPPGVMTVARVEDALGTLMIIRVVSPTTRRLAPGPLTNRRASRASCYTCTSWPTP
ncbi:hypothetical protein [Pseudonocardia charpentierae]|uniref:Uncharacterized protein n=1 Tax=Pseudonocardia charpentierae TaxID=3075545 RepID=A0ABU2NKH9_9PSEU|nr:hypothetical protein [Pseudonocardia sp. DSM 45834]MDT0353109.1 hypothetical protein [Pseudonocardia sp. DSM 45834]